MNKLLTLLCLSIIQLGYSQDKIHQFVGTKSTFYYLSETNKSNEKIRSGLNVSNEISYQFQCHKFQFNCGIGFNDRFDRSIQNQLSSFKRETLLCSGIGLLLVARPDFAFVASVNLKTNLLRNKSSSLNNFSAVHYSSRDQFDLGKLHIEIGIKAQYLLNQFLLSPFLGCSFLSTEFLEFERQIKPFVGLNTQYYFGGSN